MTIETLSGPIIGAIIGYCTNYIAVKMLFYPRKEIRVFGRKLPFTPGAIPKGKPRLAKAVAGIVSGTLLTEEDIRRKPGRGMYDDILRDHPEIDPARTIMIGDSDVDYNFAINCKISFQRIDSLKREGECKYWVNSLASLKK